MYLQEEKYDIQKAVDYFEKSADKNIDDIIFNTLGFLIGYILENLLQKILLKKQLGFGTEALILVMINGFLSIPFYEKTVSIGDMILDSLSLNSQEIVDIYCHITASITQ